MKKRTTYYILIGIVIFIFISILLVVIDLALTFKTPGLIIGLLMIIPALSILRFVIKGLLREMKEMEKEKNDKEGKL